MMRAIAALGYAVVLGLIGAAIVHIAIILLVPGYAGETLSNHIERLGAANNFHRLESPHWNRRADPLMRMSACRFDLSNGPVHISALGQVPYWSLALYTQQGDISFSVNDQVSPVTDLLIASPLQKILLEQAMPEPLENAVIIPQSADQGIAILRVFQPDDSWSDEVAEFFKSAECRTIRLDP